jgi:hypothetical protein
MPTGYDSYACGGRVDTLNNVQSDNVGGIGVINVWGDFGA